ncbi:MAG: HAD hydrolase-like protein [Bacillota bacterium]|nr:HAD hydrolase-like protein [Bacillota bacterium]
MDLLQILKHRAILFDFDGTLSLLRSGWEAVMRGFMLDCLDPTGAAHAGLAPLVDGYIAESTGIETARQMIWLAARVEERHGPWPDRDLWWYKAGYLDRLMTIVEERIALVTQNPALIPAFSVPGSHAFVQRLAAAGCELAIASGTDDPDVRREAALLGFAPHFNLIVGSPPTRLASGKEYLLGLLLERWEPAEILVIGDGPVELRLGREAGCRTLAIASREGDSTAAWCRKRDRLAAVTPDALLEDFATLVT